jgi:hypothetical protein
LRHCATNRKVTGSIPDGVIGIFHRHNPSGCTMVLGSTQPLTEMSTRNISWGVNAAGALGWQPYHLHVPTVLKSGSLDLLEPLGPVQACNGIAFFFSPAEHKAGWSAEPVWMLQRRENCLPLLRIEPWFLSYPACGLAIILLGLCQLLEEHAASMYPWW